MTCECCNRARDNPDYTWHDLKCIYCGARLIKNIQRLSIPRESKISRCRAVLTDWTAYGHDENTIRKLVKGDPVEPEPKKGKK